MNGPSDVRFTNAYQVLSSQRPSVVTFHAPLLLLASLLAEPQTPACMLAHLREVKRAELKEDEKKDGYNCRDR